MYTQTRITGDTQWFCFPALHRTRAEQAPHRTVSRMNPPHASPVPRPPGLDIGFQVDGHVSSLPVMGGGFTVRGIDLESQTPIYFRVISLVQTANLPVTSHRDLT
ncbi:hypothetical protein CRG98_033974 [Punica granatum]|uniref:Uncharacterized protein n=1 Tax=Punica granatum TaxID=22663 RepID=A0A2I0INS6_PUNGR|nr:hypothetical protein CRG98_033974 [Punica granatum]